MNMTKKRFHCFRLLVVADPPHVDETSTNVPVLFISQLQWLYGKIRLMSLLDGLLFYMTPTLTTHRKHKNETRASKPRQNWLSCYEKMSSTRR